MKNLLHAVKNDPFRQFLILAAVLALILLSYIAWEVHFIREPGPRKSFLDVDEYSHSSGINKW